MYIVIENTKRELDSKIYLAIVAARNNWSVVIGNKSNFNKQIKNFKKGVVFLKSIGERYVDLIKKGKELGHKFVSTDEEGINFFSEERLILRMNEHNYKELECFFSWGKRDSKIINEHFPEKKEKNFVVGNPRIDVIKQPLNQKYKKHAAEILKKNGNFILLASNFGKVLRSTRTDWVEDYIKAGIIKTKEEIQFEKEAVEFERKNMDKFIELTKKLSSEFPNKKFIFRPHPTEDFLYWEKIFKNCKNLKVNKDNYSTNNYIIASDILITSNCVTNIESYFLKKNSINFIPYNDQRFEFELSKLCSININKIEEVIEFIDKKRYEESAKQNSSVKNDIKNILHNFDKLDSSEEIMKIINSLNANIEDNESKDLKIPKIFFFIRIKSYLYRIYNFIKVYYNLYIKKNPGPYHLRLVALNKKDSVSSKLINETINSYLEYKNYEKNISSFELYKGLFCIQKDK